MTDPAAVRHALDDLARANDTLKTLGVARSQKVIPDFGEWFACQLLGLALCESRTQKGWDVGHEGRRVQVKAHARASTNRARRTTIRRDELNFDELLILVLTERYLVQDAYLVLRADLDVVAPFDGTKRTIRWGRLKPFRVTAIPRSLQPLMAAGRANAV